jgi:hypothetical protein
MSFAGSWGSTISRDISSANCKSARRPPINRLASLTLLAKLMDPQLSMAEIAETVQQDVQSATSCFLFIN